MKNLGILLLFSGLLTVPVFGQMAGQMAPVSSHAQAVSSPAPAANIASLAKPVIRVNGVTITERDLEEQMQRLFPYYAIHGGAVPEKYKPEIHNKAVQQLIDDELTYQAAKKLGMTVAPATMAKLMSQAHKRFPSQRQYEAYAKAQYGSVPAFERRIRRAVLIAEYQDRQIVQKSKVSDAKLREIYDQNKPRFVRPESVELQTISLNVPEKPSEEQMKMLESRINEVLPKAKAAKDKNEFGILAEKYSEDDYRVVMGDHKWVHLVGLPQQLAKAAGELKAGETSDIVKLPASWVILRVNEKKPKMQLEFSEVVGDLRTQMQKGMQQDRWESLSKEFRKNAKIEIL